ncbi:MAG: ribonuclease H-like domain-containing protein [Candidatus Woesearchaeota archaeon]
MKNKLNLYRKNLVKFFRIGEKRSSKYEFEPDEYPTFTDYLDAIVSTKKWCVFDLETKNLLKDVNNNVKKLEIALVGIMSIHGKKTNVKFYFEEDVNKVYKELLKHELIVGYNVYRFDYPVLSSYIGTKIAFVKLKTFDLFDILCKLYKKYFSLNDLIYVNFGVQKTINGINIPEYFNKGKIDVVIDHLEEDLHYTKNLFELFLNGNIKLPRGKSLWKK